MLDEVVRGIQLHVGRRVEGVRDGAGKEQGESREGEKAGREQGGSREEGKY
jgi:hypothetical protein